MDPYRDLAWATSEHYSGRTHLVLRGQWSALCGIAVHRAHDTRPFRPIVCPECAISFTSIMFPTGADQR